MSILLATRGIYRPITPPDAPSVLNPIVHLMFTETSGTTAVDDEAVQNGLYVNSPDLGLPEMEIGGGGFGMKPGQLQYCSIAHNAAFAVSGAWGLHFKFMMSAALLSVGSRYGLVSKANNAANEVTIEIIETATGPKLRAYTTTDGNVATWIGSSDGIGSDLSIGTAYNCSLVQRATGASLYLNALELATNTVTDGLDNNTAAWGIGGYLHPSLGIMIPFNGCIGGWRFFNVAPSGADLTTLPAAKNTIWLRDIENININEGTGRTLDLAPFAHPETGLTAIAGDDDVGEVVTHDTPTSSNLVLDTADVAVNTAASITAQVETVALTSREATIGLTVLAEATGGDVPAAPLLTEWLASDEADGTITKYVSNQNRGNGSGSSAANAQELQAALNGAAAGNVLLAVCQTPGATEHWTYASGLTMPSGISGSRITLKARLGDAVVINAGGEFGGSRTPNSGFWTQSGLSADDISKKIWRSASVFTGGAQIMMGMWIEFDHPHQLLSAGSMTNLRAAYGTADSPTNYSGPMVFKNTDDRIYIRFQRPHVGKYSVGNKWSEQTWPGHPEAISGGQLVYPLSEDPNDYVIHVFRVSSVNGAFKTGQWTKIGPGINSCGFQHAIGASNTWLDRGTHLTWRHGTRTPGAAITNIFCNRARFSDGSKIHVSRAEWKFGGWLEGPYRSAWLTTTASNTLSHIYCKDCTIADYHELCVNGWNLNGHFRWRNCTFISIYDDGIQALMSQTRTEFGYCYFLNSAYGGMGEGINELSDPNPGGWFIHHNIMDLRQERNTDWRSQPHPHFLYCPHSPDDNRPVRQYNNLFIWGPDSENEFGIGMEHSSQADGGNNTSAVMHECFNNILLRVHLEGTKRYDPWAGAEEGSYSDSFADDRSDFVLGVLTRYSAAESNELFDYNCYWRPATLTTDALFRGHRRGGVGNPTFNFASIAAWKAHAEFTHSKSSGALRGAYSPGFDGNSTDTKPTIPTIDDYPTSRFNYRPSPTGAVTVATSSSLSGTNWWTTPPTWGTTYFNWSAGGGSLAPSPWKGALDPNGSTMTVGVQNP